MSRNYLASTSLRGTLGWVTQPGPSSCQMPTSFAWKDIGRKHGSLTPDSCPSNTCPGGHGRGSSDTGVSFPRVAWAVPHLHTPCMTGSLTHLPANKLTAEPDLCGPTSGPEQLTSAKLRPSPLNSRFPNHSPPCCPLLPIPWGMGTLSPGTSVSPFLASSLLYQPNGVQQPQVLCKVDQSHAVLIWCTLNHICSSHPCYCPREPWGMGNLTQSCGKHFSKCFVNSALITVLQGALYFTHSTDEETEAKRN
jgi:hypothetical protein